MMPVHPSADNAVGIPNTGFMFHEADDWGILPEIPRAEFCNHRSSVKAPSLIKRCSSFLNLGPCPYLHPCFT